MAEYGFRVIIASSFADIFYNNSLKNDLLPVVLPEEKVAELVRRTTENENYQLTVDLETQTVTGTESFNEKFSVDEFSSYCLLNGLDDIALTLQNETAIGLYKNHAGF